eukprot:CAMPEP_0118966972 /NCGR_PEP_ID=MMETSP1173-20130426/4410_1 /TAXON_ID=1034831 /ORGANISM="Rhizochromulina marina cf, Strain CCMP1243" /LENGTH=220 /DNA_ID=CAMNT_0006915857 /DNA_START=102 /DNA_END=764 /DNA_ORIENTATION=+
MPLSPGECEAMVTRAFQDDKLSVLRAAIERHEGRAAAPEGCGRPLRISCRDCRKDGVEGCARAFTEAEPMGVVLCTNRLESCHEVREVLRHELTHAYDYCVAGLDLFKCTALAYSEVRAARDAECSSYKDFPSFLGWIERNCARRTAVSATRNLFPQEGRDCVAQVFVDAHADQSPFISSSSSSSSSSSTSGSSTQVSPPPPAPRIPLQLGKSQKESASP